MGRRVADPPLPIRPAPWYCPRCGRRNRIEKHSCSKCGKIQEYQNTMIVKKGRVR